MNDFKPLLRASAIALLASATAASADVSAQDVWTQLKSYLSQGGQTLSTGSEAMSGDTLTVSDIKVEMTSQGANTTTTIPELAFREQGDGTVSITMPPAYTIAMVVKPKSGPETTLNLKVTDTDLSTTVSGTPDNMTYVFDGKEVAVVLDSISGPASDEFDANGAVRLSGISGNYSMTSGDPVKLDAAVKASKLSAEVDLKGKNNTGSLSGKIETADVSVTSKGGMPGVMMNGDLRSMLKAGLDMTASVSSGATTYAINVDDQTGTLAVSGASKDSGLDVAFSKDGISYKTRASGMSMTASGSQIPLPQIDFKLSELALGVAMPIQKSDTPQDVSLLVRLIDLAVGDDIWGMVDPGGALPHDPATLILDLSGKAKWLIDITNPVVDTQIRGLYLQPSALNLNELKLSAAGAEITGKGAFTFDSSDLTTWNGVPAPDGSAEFKLVGINGLIGKLVQMGLIPQDQAMMAQMSMGMFTKPGQGEDTLTSKIEVTKDGGILANGQRLR